MSDDRDALPWWTIPDALYGKTDLGYTFCCSINRISFPEMAVGKLEKRKIIYDIARLVKPVGLEVNGQIYATV